VFSDLKTADPVYGLGWSVYEPIYSYAVITDGMKKVVDECALSKGVDMESIYKDAYLL